MSNYQYLRIKWLDLCDCRHFWKLLSCSIYVPIYRRIGYKLAEILHLKDWVQCTLYSILFFTSSLKCNNLGFSNWIYALRYCISKIGYNIWYFGNIYQIYIILCSWTNILDITKFMSRPITSTDYGCLLFCSCSLLTCWSITGSVLW